MNTFENISTLLEKGNFTIARDILYNALVANPNSSLLNYQYAHTLVCGLTVRNDFSELGYFTKNINQAQYSEIRNALLKAIDLNVNNLVLYLDLMHLEYTYQASYYGKHDNLYWIINHTVTMFQHDNSALFHIINHISQWYDISNPVMRKTVILIRQYAVKNHHLPSTDNNNLWFIKIQLKIYQFRNQIKKFTESLEQLVILEPEEYRWHYLLAKQYLNLPVNNSQRSEIKNLLNRTEGLEFQIIKDKGTYYFQTTYKWDSITTDLINYNQNNDDFISNLKLCDKYLKAKIMENIWIENKLVIILQYIEHHIDALNYHSIKQFSMDGDSTFNRVHTTYVYPFKKLELAKRLCAMHWTVFLKQISSILHKKSPSINVEQIVKNARTIRHSTIDKRPLQMIVQYAYFINQTTCLDKTGLLVGTFQDKQYYVQLIIANYLLNNFKDTLLLIQRFQQCKYQCDGIDSIKNQCLQELPHKNNFVKP